MRVYLTSSSADTRDGRQALKRMLSAAEADRHGVHELVRDGLTADVVILVEGTASRGFERRLLNQAAAYGGPGRCFVYLEYDSALAVLPGLYPASPGRFIGLLKHVSTGPYVSQYPNEFVIHERATVNSDDLYQFMGSLDTSPVRRRIASLKHPRGVVIDVTKEAYRNRTHMTSEERREYRRKYAETLTGAKFILCPRGLSPSSVRMYETMRAGRVPVIISDAWVPPTGPDWSSFSVRIPEKRIDTIPDLLESIEPRAAEMGFLAKRAWDEWFADDVVFHRMVEWCLEIQKSRWLSPWLERSIAMTQVLRKTHCRAFFRERLEPARRRIRGINLKPKRCCK